MAENQQQSGGSGIQQNRGKKRSKSYYVRAKEGKRVRKDMMLTVGMKGVLLTCNHGIKPCIKEAYNLLAEYADQLYGPEKDLVEEDEQSPASDDEDDCEDMEASLQKEIDGMKKQRKDRQQRFQAVESGAKNVAFIKAKIDNPCELVHRILTDIQQTKTSKSRHIMRMLPVTATYRSYLEDIEKQAGRILKPHFELDDGQELSFCIMFKVRNCGHLKRNDVITTLHRMVTEMGKHRVDLTNPDRAILVEGVRNVCCISVLKDFYKLKRYNLHAITEEFTGGDKEERYRRKKPKKATDSSGTDVAKDKTGEKGEIVEEKSAEGNLHVATDDSNGNKDTDGKNESQVTTGGPASDVTASEGGDKMEENTDEDKKSSESKMCESGDKEDEDKEQTNNASCGTSGGDGQELKCSTGEEQGAVANISEDKSNAIEESVTSKSDEMEESIDKGGEQDN